MVGELLARGDEVTVLSRDEAYAAEQLRGAIPFGWRDPLREPAPSAAFEGRDAVVHLAGEPIAQRWTADVKRRIRASRELGTRNLVAGMMGAEQRPRVLVSQSAVGYYGPHGDERLDESTPPATGDFLADAVVAWEQEARAAEELGMRVVTTRTGVVLSESGGALAKMLPPFRMGVGGPVAGGKQYVPWIHLDDVAGVMLRALGDDELSGAVNLTAPEPVTNKELSRTLGHVLVRPAITPVPAFALRLLYGEMAEIVTTGQRAVPARLDRARPRVRLSHARARAARGGVPLAVEQALVLDEGAAPAAAAEASPAALDERGNPDQDQAPTDHLEEDQQRGAHGSAFAPLLFLALRARLGDRRGAAPRDRALDLPARVSACGPQQPDHNPDGAQDQARGQAWFLSVALAVRQPRRRDRRGQPDVGEPQGLGAEECEYGHAPRYAFWTSGFSRSEADSSDSATVPVSST